WEKEVMGAPVQPHRLASIDPGNPGNPADLSNPADPGNPGTAKAPPRTTRCATRFATRRGAKIAGRNTAPATSTMPHNAGPR
ncbi:MAG: hypothetical protein AAGE13_12240, partial [Pseudomonadota bacterium]